MLQTVEKKRIRLSKSARKARGRIRIVETPCKVRVATRDDFLPLLEMFRIVHSENGSFSYDEAKAAEAVWPTLNGSKGIVGVIGDTDNLEGFIFLVISSGWYSNDPVLEERCVFVREEYRHAKDSRAQKLLEFAKKCSADLEMPLMIGIFSNTRTSAKVSLYERHFGQPAGAFFYWNDKTSQNGKN